MTCFLIRLELWPVRIRNSAKKVCRIRSIGLLSSFRKIGETLPNISTDQCKFFATCTNIGSVCICRKKRMQWIAIVYGGNRNSTIYRIISCYIRLSLPIDNRMTIQLAAGIKLWLVSAIYRLSLQVTLHNARGYDGATKYITRKKPNQRNTDRLTITMCVCLVCEKKATCGTKWILSNAPTQFAIIVGMP